MLATVAGTLAGIDGTAGEHDGQIPSRFLLERDANRNENGIGLRMLRPVAPDRKEKAMSRMLPALDAEWSRLACSPAARAALARWATDEPAMSGYGDLDEVLAARRDPATDYSVLAALARLAPADDLAARTLLQAMLPGVIRVASRSDGDNAVDDVIGLAWERIRTYPSARPGSPAANILLDVRKQYVRHRALERGEVDPRCLRDEEHVRSPEDVVVGLDLFRQVAWARRQGLISSDDLRAIVRTRIDGDRARDLAAEEQVTVRTIRKRRRRGEKALRTTLALAG